MKRRDLIKHLETFGCYLLKEGRKHSRFINLGDTDKQATVPRYREVDDYLARMICRQLAIPPPM